MKPVRMLVALAVVGILTVGVGAQEEKKKKKGAGRPAVAGVVEKIDGKTITVRSGKKNDPNAKMTEVTVDDSTKFGIRSAEGRKEAKLDDVTKGKRVNVITKKTAEGKEIAVAVVIQEAPPKK